LGQVSVALDLELQREVALKEIQNQHADNPESRHRFLNEARITGGLEHPGVVPVYGLCQYADGRPYYAMRFIRGHSLKDEIERYHRSAQRQNTRDRPLALRQLLDRFLDVCNAVEYAHSRGILHRDLKPANVMLGAYGETLVVDWGLAKPFEHLHESNDSGPGDLRLDLSGDSTPTVMGAAVGTPHYMSPEQAAGQLDRLGPASDVYSLGATLYQLLTGETPIRGDNVGEVLARVQEGDFPSPRELRRDIPRALEAICLKAMARQPEERYASPQALAQDVELWLADEPTSMAHCESIFERGGRFLRTHKAAVTSALALLVTAVAALSVSTAVIADARDREHFQFKQAESARHEAATLAEAEKQANQQLEQTLYFNRIALIERELSGGNVARGQELLDACSEKDHQSWEWRYLDRRAREGVDYKAMGHGDPIFEADFSPDGARLVTGSLNGTIKIWDARSGKELKSLRAGLLSIASGLAFARDGRLATAISSALRHSQVTIYASSDADKELLTIAGPTGFVSDIQFSPDGRWLALAAHSGAAHIYDARTGEETQVLRGHDRPLRSVTFHPDGHVLVTAGDDRLIRLWDWRAGKLQRELKGHTAEVFCAIFSPDGNSLASSSLDGTIVLWDAHTGRVRRELFGDFGPVQEVTFHPDGTRLAAANHDRSVKLWDTATGQEVLALRGHDDIVGCLRFSPDGNLLASADWGGAVHLFDARPLTDKPPYQLRTLKGHDGVVFIVDYHPDGRRLISGSADGTIRIWDAVSGKHLNTLHGHTGMVMALEISPDGKRLLSASSDELMLIWDLQTGKILSTIDTVKASIWQATFNEDGSQIACNAGIGGDVRIFNAQTGKEIRRIPAHIGGTYALRYSPDGKFLATGGFDRGVRIFDAASGQLLHTLTGHTNVVYAAEFSPDGQTLATASGDRTIRLWDVATQKQLLCFKEHTDRVYDVAFSADGRLLASTGADGTVKIWQASDGKIIANLRGHSGVVADADFSPDGRRLASSSGFRKSGEIIIWDFAAIEADHKKK
ncbi:MAG: protein kinase, partial [Gemmataceae bacterium]